MLVHWKHTYGDLLFIQGCSDAAPKHCSTGQGRKASPLFSAALQNRHTACMCHWSHTYGDLLFIQVCSDATPKHCSTGQGRKASPLFSAALQNRPTACLCHWNHTYGDLLFIQGCSDAAPKHCSTGQGRKASPLFTAALQNRLTACSCHWNHTYEDMLFIQVCSHATPKHCSTGQGKKASPLFSAALQNRLTACLCTGSTPMEICSSYRGAVMQHQSTAALVRAEKLPHCSVLLCKTGTQHACATGVTPMEICCSYRCAVAGQKRLPTVHCCFAKQADSMFMPLESHLWRFAVHTGVQSCNTKALQHWQGRKDSPLFTAALQNRLTACLCHWNHTCGDLLFIQGCSDAAPKHCSTGRAEKTPHCSVLLCKTGPQQACGAEITPVEICSSYRGAVMQHQSTAALAGQKRLPTVHCCLAKQADSMFMPLESHLWRFAVHAGVQ